MVVTRVPVFAFFLSACTSLSAVPQEAYVRASVDATEVAVEREFWIHIEAQGEQVQTPVLPENIDGLWINPNPNTVRSLTWTPTATRHIEKLSFSAIAVQPGPITIPAIRVLINGRPMYTEPIQLTAVGEPTKTPQAT